MNMIVSNFWEKNHL